jgi:integrase
MQKALCCSDSACLRLHALAHCCRSGACYFDASKHGSTTMAKGKITKTAVDALEPKRRADGSLADGYLWDSEAKGFGCKATPGGKKVFIVQYRLGGRAGKAQRVTLGIHGKITADQARKMALAELGKVADGQDPAAAKRDERRKLSGETFEAVAARYLSMNGKNNKTWPETRRILDRDAIPALGNRPMAVITRGEVAALLDRKAQHSQSGARAVFAQLRPLFKWALDREIIERNPIADLKGPAPLDDRKRKLDHAEIRAFWKATCAFDYPWAPFFRLLLLTGQRREEVSGMRWAEINLDKGFWRLPSKEEYQPQRTKNGEEHFVDLSAQALAILNGLPGSRQGLVFTTTGKTPISGFSKVKARLDALMAARLDGQLRPWRNHDLRRTVSTLMGEDLGIAPAVIDRIQNHTTGLKANMRGPYQLQQLLGPRRDALLRWGEHVEQLTSG